MRDGSGWGYIQRARDRYGDGRHTWYGRRSTAPSDPRALPTSATSLRHHTVGAPCLGGPASDCDGKTTTAQTMAGSSSCTTQVAGENSGGELRYASQR